MDNDTRDAFGSLMTQMAGIAADVAAGSSLGRQTLSAVNALAPRVDRLEKHVFGDEPPPPMPPPRPALQRITSSEGELADLAGRMLAIQGEVEAARTEIAGVRTMTSDQNEEIGKVKATVTELAERPDSAEIVIAEIKAASGTPLGQKLIGAVAGVVLLVLGLVGLELKAKIATIEERTANPPAVVVRTDDGSKLTVVDGGAPRH
jgi:hypothetical protein